MQDNAVLLTRSNDTRGRPPWSGTVLPPTRDAFAYVILGCCTNHQGTNRNNFFFYFHHFLNTMLSRNIIIDIKL